MSRQVTRSWAWVLMGTLLLSGCVPRQPFYLHEDGDLSHLVDQQLELVYPDLDHDALDEAEYSRPPRTVTNPDFDEIWELKLEDAMAIALQNSKILRSFSGGINRGGLGTITGLAPDRLLSSQGQAPSIYDPALTETNPNAAVGPIAALAAFDAQFNANLTWGKTDRPRNVTPFPGLIANVTVQDQGRGLFTITKRSAAGTQFRIASDTLYTQSTQNFGLISDWFQAFEVGATQPLLRGAGTQVNRANISITRINSDITLAQFEADVRNLVSDVERAYWEVYFNYRALEAAKIGRDANLVTWKKVYALMVQSTEGGEADKEAQAREQYFFFRNAVEEALRNVFASETRLRYIMGLTATDGRLIRPADEPTVAKVTFDWHTILCEGLTRTAELREHMWRIKQEELGLITARNQLLPQLDLTATYRWLGVGDDLIEARRSGLNFPAPGSTAFDDLTEGRYQEYEFGLVMEVPLGFRAELARVRNTQLRIARARALLHEMELEVSHLLSDAVQELDGQYVAMQTNFNRLVSAQDQVAAMQAAYEAGTVTLDLLLDAQRRRAEAEIAYYQALVEYNLAITNIHFRKGSLLEINGIQLAEGPWPSKAYFDAHSRARRRDASYYLDYGFTRPRVISQGEVQQHVGQADLYEQYVPDGETLESIEPQPTPADPPAELPNPGSLRDVPGPVTATEPAKATGPTLAAPKLTAQASPKTSVKPAVEKTASARPSARKQTASTEKKGSSDWGTVRLKSRQAAGRTPASASKVRQAAHLDWKTSWRDESGADHTSDQADRTPARE